MGWCKWWWLVVEMSQGLNGDCESLLNYLFPSPDSIPFSLRELKLPVHHNLFFNGLEDTYCHQVIDALVASHFPARSTNYSVDWANGEARGSKRRRGHGYRPDACIKKHGRQIAFLEFKPPGDNHTVREYLWDYWNLANYAKDAIDLFLQEGLAITMIAVVQLFRKSATELIMNAKVWLFHLCFCSDFPFSFWIFLVLI